jgi:hypothetical protein
MILMRQGSDPLEPSGSRCWVNGTGGGLYFKCDLLVALFICMPPGYQIYGLPMFCQFKKGPAFLQALRLFGGSSRT